MDRRLWAVSGEHPGGGREREKLAPDCVEQLPIATPGKVGATDGLGEKSVPSEGDGLFGEVKDEAVRRMARDVEEIEGLASEVQGLFAFEDPVHGVGLDGDGQSPSCGFLGEGQIGAHGGEGVNGGTHLSQFGGIFDVIEMMVGEEQGEWGQAGGANLFCHSFRGIDDDETLGGFQKVAIGGDRASGVSEWDHGEDFC